MTRFSESRPIRFGSRGVHLVGYLYATFFGALAIVLLVVVPEPGAKILTSGFNLALALFFGMRFGQLGPSFEPEGLRIRRVYSSQFIPWERISRFALRPHGPLRLMAHAELIDGSFVWIEGVGVNPMWKGRIPRAEATIRAMTKLLNNTSQGLQTIDCDSLPIPPSDEVRLGTRPQTVVVGLERDDF